MKDKKYEFNLIKDEKDKWKNEWLIDDEKVNSKFD